MSKVEKIKKDVDELVDLIQNMIEEHKDDLDVVFFVSLKQNDGQIILDRTNVRNINSFNVFKDLLNLHSDTLSEYIRFKDFLRFEKFRVVCVEDKGSVFLSKGMTYVIENVKVGQGELIFSIKDKWGFSKKYFSSLKFIPEDYTKLN